jgi:hypothetical protein
VAKYNPDGTLAWAKNTGGLNPLDNISLAFVFEISAFPDSSAVVVGCFVNSAVFGAGEANETELTCDCSGILLAKYNSDGTLAWAKGAGGTGNNFAVGVSTLPDGVSAVIGYFECSTTFGEGEDNETVLTSADDLRPFIAMYDPDGMLLWVKSPDCITYDGKSADISALEDGSVIVTGGFRYDAVFGAGESNETVLTSTGASAGIYLAKYNPDGTLAWAKAAADGSLIPPGLSTFRDGSAIMTGSYSRDVTFGPGGDNETVLVAYDQGEYPLSDAFFAKFNPDGNLVWARGAVGIYDDLGWAVAALADGSALVTGIYDYEITFDTGEISETTFSPGIEYIAYTLFIAKLNP